MNIIKIGGVPEHFNLPWRLLLERGAGTLVEGSDVLWRDYPGGSGAMASALRSGELDAALLLTEGAVAGVATGGGFKIASVYVESPLIWGIHVPAASAFESVAELEHARYAISRHGSGSHLMAFVHARQRGWQPNTLPLVVVGDVHGAVEAFDAGIADVFFWEKFMTKPLVDAGRFRRIGEFAAPWPAFVLCVANSASDGQRRRIAVLHAAALAEAQRLVARADAAELIAGRYGLLATDVTDWLGTTRWAARSGVALAHVEDVVESLRGLDLIAEEFPAAAVLEPFSST